MAGRPIKMARRVEELETVGVNLFIAIYDTAPRQYVSERPEKGQLGRAWREVVNSAMQLTVRLEELGDLLRERAEISEPGPTETFFDGPEEEMGDTLAAAPQTPVS